MPILPLAQFEADLAEQDRETYEKLKPPSSVVVKFGSMGLIGEFPYGLEDKPGCGTKFVLKTHRGTELGEMLTSTCPNSGCGKSISRKEMLEYIDRSGGKDYPFFSMQGKVLRIATVEDLNQQTRLDQTRPQMTRHAKALVERMKLPMKLVDAEPILGGEKVTFYFISEERIDFRELVAELAAEHNTRIEMRQVGSRDEARLTADYEKCGQHCCCKQFLKILKPVSMKNAKIQKATLDPLKISGRCGRLMCCLRYEESTYDDLRARLPKKRTRVSGEFGTGFVLDTQILTQLCLIQLDDKDERIAVALEELTILGPGGPPQQQRPQGAPRSDVQGSKGGAEGRGGTGSSLPVVSIGDAEETEDSEVESLSDPESSSDSERAPSASSGSPPPPSASPQQPRRDDRRPQGPPPSPGPRPDQPRQQRPQWPTNKPQRGPSQGHPSAGPGGSGPGGPPRPDTRPPQDRAPRPPQDRPPQPPQSQPPRPPQQQPPRPPEPRDEIDELLGDIETDMGDGRGSGAGGGGGQSGNRGPDSGGGPDGGGGRKRRRKRRRGGGGGGGPGGQGGGGGGGGPPPA